jgi:hypothetical protein
MPAIDTPIILIMLTPLLLFFSGMPLQPLGTLVVLVSG